MPFKLEAARKFAQVCGSTMSYIDIGDGPVVVLAHSYLWSAQMWEPQIAALSRHCRVIVPELWGHGKSGALPPGTASMRQLARQHLDLLDGLGIEKCVIAGLSVGGMWGGELAVMAPDRVAGLVLLGTYLGSEPAASRARYFAMLKTVEEAGAVPDPLAQALLPLFFSAISIAHSPRLTHGFRERLRDIDRATLLHSVVPLGRLIFDRRDALDDLRQLPMPVLVITGDEDRSRPPAEGRAMAALLGCRFVELAGVGHVSSLEAPNEVTGHLLSFLDAALQRD